jgi:predicted nucleotidyltransferase
MNVAHPIRGIIPTLDAPVVETLAGTTRPLTGREVHRLTGGEQSRRRLVLGRLVEQGLVLAEARSNAVFYVANRQHLAWPALENLVRLRLVLHTRLVEEIAAWPLQPLHASLFGSAARGDGDSSSDIDVLLIRPDRLESLERWEEQVDRLRAIVPAWTGNRCQAFDIGRQRLAEHVAAHDPLVDDWLTEGVHLGGSPLRDLVAARSIEAQPDESARKWQGVRLRPS